MFVHKIDQEIYLKLIQLQDAEKIFNLTNESRSYLREWLPWLDGTTTIDDTRKFIEFSMKGFAENKSMNTVILYKDTIVGVAGYNEIDWTNRIAYIGYWISKQHQGKGIMTRVVKGLTDYAFNEINLNRVDIRAATENKNSRKIPERLGFVKEGKVRKAERLYDRYVDHVIYGMLAEEWEKQSGD